MIIPAGSPTARIMVVGEYPTYNEEREGVPLAGEVGKEFNRMLHEAGIMGTECFTTLVIRELVTFSDKIPLVADSKKVVTENPQLYHPFRDRMVRKQIVDGAALLAKEVDMVRPNIIIALGNIASFVLTGRWSVQKNRGSMLYGEAPFPKVKVIPVIHPSYILRDWSARAMTISDLKRVARFRNGEDYPHPKWQFRIRPSFQSVMTTLTDLRYKVGIAPVWIDFDLETKQGHIDCAGISWSRTEALCIPLMSAQNKQGYWTELEEAVIVWNLYKLLTHPNCWVRGQNWLYDAQYTYRHWHFVPNFKQDTMVSQHVMFCGLKKSLDFQASLYCDYYVQWKPDKAAWAEGK